MSWGLFYNELEVKNQIIAMEIKLSIERSNMHFQGRHDIQTNDTQHKGFFATLSITAFSKNDTQHKSTNAIMLNAIVLNVTFYILLC
jgi:hypothetical protein